MPEAGHPFLRPAIRVRHGRRWSSPRTMAAPTRRHNEWAARVAVRSSRSRWPGRIERWVGRIGLVLARMRHLARIYQRSTTSPAPRAPGLRPSSSELGITALRDRFVVRLASSGPMTLGVPLAPPPVMAHRVAGPDPAASAETHLAATSALKAPILGYSQLKSVFRELRTIERALSDRVEPRHVISDAGGPRDNDFARASKASNGEGRHASSNDLKHATAPISARGEQVDIEVVADRVLERIQSRAVAWRERLGRA